MLPSTGIYTSFSTSLAILVLLDEVVPVVLVVSSVVQVVLVVPALLDATIHVTASAITVITDLYCCSTTD